MIRPSITRNAPVPISICTCFSFCFCLVALQGFEPNKTSFIFAIDGEYNTLALPPTKHNPPSNNTTKERVDTI